jgi:hypothetical protein
MSMLRQPSGATSACRRSDRNPCGDHFLGDSILQQPAGGRLSTSPDCRRASGAVPAGAGPDEQPRAGDRRQCLVRGSGQAAAARCRAAKGAGDLPHTLAGLGGRLVDITTLDPDASAELLDQAVRAPRPGMTGSPTTRNPLPAGPVAGRQLVEIVFTATVGLPLRTLSRTAKRRPPLAGIVRDLRERVRVVAGERLRPGVNETETETGIRLAPLGARRLPGPGLAVSQAGSAAARSGRGEDRVLAVSARGRIPASVVEQYQAAAKDAKPGGDRGRRPPPESSTDHAG